MWPDGEPDLNHDLKEGRGADTLKMVHVDQATILNVDTNIDKSCCSVKKKNFKSMVFFCIKYWRGGAYFVRPTGPQQIMFFPVTHWLFISGEKMTFNESKCLEKTCFSNKRFLI